MTVLNEKIAYYRRLNGFTQAELAEATGVSVAAVSKWEQGISCPDIACLPIIAEIFNISIDELFGKQVVKEPIYDFVDSVPWNDDGKGRIALFYGKKLMKQSEYEIQKENGCFTFRFDGVSEINGQCRYTNK